jgi:hypothetical protein
MPEKLKQLAQLANVEFRSKRVPKSTMTRQRPDGKDEKGRYKYSDVVEQFSTIIGSVPPKPHMRRAYPNISSVHSVPSAKQFIKAMMLLCREAESIVHDILPEQYERQLKIFERVPDKWKFGKLFTSSISNYNISAPFHRDTGNIKKTINIIVTKKLNATGGNLHVPDYDATMDSADNSLLVYPAWKNVHGVTPIVETQKGGYRNSLIFYPLQAFLESDK